MNHPKRFFKVVAVALAATLLTAACSTISGGKKADYKKARTTESLEVPPDLTATSIKEAPDLPSAAGTSLSEMNRSAPAAGTPTVLPQAGDIRVEHDGNLGSASCKPAGTRTVRISPRTSFATPWARCSTSSTRPPPATSSGCGWNTEPHRTRRNCT